MATGSKSARMTLAEGLAFLTSAMSRIGPGPARTARKSRTGGASAAWASSSSSGIRRRAATTSRRFEATISSSMVILVPQWSKEHPSPIAGPRCRRPDAGVSLLILYPPSSTVLATITWPDARRPLEFASRVPTTGRAGSYRCR